MSDAYQPTTVLPAPPPPDAAAGPGTAYLDPPSLAPGRAGARFVPTGRRAQLLVSTGPQAGRVVDLDPGARFSVGRAPDADLLLADVTVSRRHAVVHGERQRYVLYDAGSRNGTYLNGHRVTAAVLDEGDEIVVGVFTLRFRTQPSTPPASR